MSEAPQQPLIRFANLFGALVLVNEHPTIAGRYAALCTGCLAVLTSGSDYYSEPDPKPVYLPEARTWANEHAATCRALPDAPPAA